jgi:dienelactone hydrolase
MTASSVKQLIRMATDSVEVDGLLELPERPRGVVLFAHGSGSSRLSPRNNHVAGEIRRQQIATLLMDLLTPIEDHSAAARFDIALLTRRLDSAIDWLRRDARTGALPIGLFGASTGAAAALRAAATHGGDIAAVVARGGRPDLAGRAALERVRAPTLLIVGGRDDVVIDINRTALAALRCDKRLDIIPGATHLFEEPGALETVATLAAHWFAAHLGGAQEVGAPPTQAG